MKSTSKANIKSKAKGKKPSKPASLKSSPTKTTKPKAKRIMPRVKEVKHKAKTKTVKKGVPKKTRLR